jgi:hypothetical protein
LKEHSKEGQTSMTYRSERQYKKIFALDIVLKNGIYNAIIRKNKTHVKNNMWYLSFCG